MNFTLIEKYFPALTSSQRENFAALGALYADWNEKINVISRKDMENFYLHHVLHSLAIAKVHTFAKGEVAIDIGTGGGFPGIPLAILFPDTHFILVDSIAKKLKVADGIKDALKLSNVETAWKRAETLDIPCDYILSRAVTRLLPFYEWIRHIFPIGASKGLYYLKGGDLNEELYELTYKYKNVKIDRSPISNFFEEEFFDTKEVLHVYIPTKEEASQRK